MIKLGSGERVKIKFPKEVLNEISLGRRDAFCVIYSIDPEMIKYDGEVATICSFSLGAGKATISVDNGQYLWDIRLLKPISGYDYNEVGYNKKMTRYKFNIGDIVKINSYALSLYERKITYSNSERYISSNSFAVITNQLTIEKSNYYKLNIDCGESIWREDILQKEKDSKDNHTSVVEFSCDICPGDKVVFNNPNLERRNFYSDSEYNFYREHVNNVMTIKRCFYNDISHYYFYTLLEDWELNGSRDNTWKEDYLQRYYPPEALYKVGDVVRYRDELFKLRIIPEKYKNQVYRITRVFRDKIMGTVVYLLDDSQGDDCVRESHITLEEGSEEFYRFCNKVCSMNCGSFDCPLKKYKVPSNINDYQKKITSEKPLNSYKCNEKERIF